MEKFMLYALARTRLICHIETTFFPGRSEATADPQWFIATHLALGGFRLFSGVLFTSRQGIEPPSPLANRERVQIIWPPDF
jgi:hypothetical protein